MAVAICIHLEVLLNFYTFCTTSKSSDTCSSSILEVSPEDEIYSLRKPNFVGPVVAKEPQRRYCAYTKMPAQPSITQTSTSERVSGLAEDAASMALP